jgi:DNA polymerase III gamma/tau subunit
MEEGVSLPEFTKEMIEFLRKILIIKVSGKLESFANLGIDQEKAAKILRLVQELNYGRIIMMINVFLDKVKDLKYAEIPQLPLELAIVEIGEEETNTDGQDQKDAGGTSSGTINEYEKVKEKLKKEQIDQQVKSKTSPIKSSRASLDKSHISSKASLAELKDQWKNILRAIKANNHSLAVVLKVANIVSLRDDVLSLGYRYKFYSERVQDRHNLDVIEGTITKIIKKKVKVECLVGEEFAMSEEKRAKIKDSNIQDNIWKTALEAFGGQIVE